MAVDPFPFAQRSCLRCGRAWLTTVPIDLLIGQYCPYCISLQPMLSRRALDTVIEAEQAALAVAVMEKDNRRHRRDVETRIQAAIATHRKERATC